MKMKGEQFLLLANAWKCLESDFCSLQKFPSRNKPNQIKNNQNHFTSRVPFFSAIALALASDSADSTGFREYTKLPSIAAKNMVQLDKSVIAKSGVRTVFA